MWNENLNLERATAVLMACEDFATETTALQQLVLDRGHVLVMTPKAHPEIAGCGVELAWGKTKRDFRWLNDCNPKHLHSNILKAFVSMDIERMRRFARKTREYKRAYRIYHAPGGDVKDHTAIDKFVKKAKTHRSTLDQDFAFINAS